MDVNNTEQSLQETTQTLQEYKDIAEQINKFIEKGDDYSDVVRKVGEEAESALQKIDESKQNVGDLSTTIDGIDGIDLRDLIASEEELKTLDDQVDALVTEEINVLERRLETQEYRLQQYEDDLSELKKQIQHNMNLFDALPTTCFKVASNFEQ